MALGMGSVWEFGASQSLKKNYLDVPLEDRINGDRISGWKTLTDQPHV